MKLILLFAALILATGCVSYRRPAADFLPKKDDPGYSLQARASTNQLYRIIPRKRGQIRWFDAPHWLSSDLLGNDEDGIFGEASAYSAHLTFGTFCLWQLRNPLHNFDFYVIGSAGWRFHHHLSIISTDADGARLFSSRDPGPVGPGRAAFQFSFNDFKPFLSFKLFVVESYLGWRPEGNFGVALRGSHHQTNSPVNPPKATSKPAASAGPTR